MQAANTGLTGGSTPFGDNYDRPISRFLIQCESTVFILLIEGSHK